MVDFIPETRKTVRQRVGRLLYPSADDFQVATLGVGSTTSVLLSDAFRLVPDESYIGKVANIVDGALAGAVRYVSDSDQSDGSVTVDPVLGGSPASGVQVEIWPNYRVIESINDHINLAIHRAADIVNVYTESVATLDSDRNVITVPAGLVKVVGVRYIDAYDRVADYTVTQDPWQDPYGFPSAVVRGGFIYLNQVVPDDASAVYVRGYRLPALPTADADLLEINPAYLTYMAAYSLDAGVAYGPSFDPEQHSMRSSNWHNQAKDIESRMATRWLPDTVAIEG